MKSAGGLTLVEVLVAMTLLALVCTASLAFVARGRAAHRAGEALARADEALDAGYAVLVDELRMAGYLGLAPAGVPVAGANPLGTAEPAALAVSGSCGPSLAHDLARPVVIVDGIYAAAPGMPLGCQPSPNGRAVAGADTLTVRRAAAEETSPQTGRLQLETTLRAARLATDGAGWLGPEARWHDLEVSVFYVSADSTGQRGWPSLRRKRLVGGLRPLFQDEELVSGIEDLQVEPVMGTTAGSTVRALSIHMTARSEAGDHRLRHASRVVALRNTELAP